MQKFSQPLKDKDVTWGIGASLGVGLGVFMLSRLIAGFLIAGVAGSRGQTISEFFGEDNYQLSFVISLVVSFLTAALLMLYVKRERFWSKLAVRKTSLDDMLTALPTYFGYFALAFAANALLIAFFPDLDFDVDQQTGFEDATGGALTMAFITLVIVAPVFEELLFRGFVFRGLAKATAFWPAAITTSLLFGLAHATSLESNQMALVLDTFMVGMATSWLVWHTKSLWPGILLHGIKNFIAFLFIFVIEI